MTAANATPDAAPADRFFARSVGLIHPDIESRSVLMIGCGSVGSYLAEQLVRTGVKRLTLLDGETVAPENLSRSVYLDSHVGTAKVTALQAHLQAINPQVQCNTHLRELQAFTRPELFTLISAHDLVVGATDDPAAQLLLNQLCFAAEKPAVYIALARKAEGGEVLIAVPTLTPCYSCQTGGVRNNAELPRAEFDYGANRLVGEMALGCDIHHVASVGVKLTLGLLCLELQPVPEATRLACALLGSGKSYGLFSMREDYGFFPAVFASAAGQFAYQSVWPKTSCRSDCGVCGTPEFREPWDRSSGKLVLDLGALATAES